jgi:hypothetical protein
MLRFSIERQLEIIGEAAITRRRIEVRAPRKIPSLEPAICELLSDQ